MMRADALNSRVYPVRTEMTAMKYIPILQVFSMENIESKDFLLEKHYCMSVLQTRMNQKASSSMKFLRRKAYQNTSIKILTNKKT